MVRDKLIEFVRDTARHITSTADVSPEVQQLRYCLCAVARQCGVQLGEALPQAFPAQVRVWAPGSDEAVGVETARGVTGGRSGRRPPGCPAQPRPGRGPRRVAPIPAPLHRRPAALCTTCSACTARRRSSRGSSAQTCGASSRRVTGGRGWGVEGFCLPCCTLRRACVREGAWAHTAESAMLSLN